MAWLNVLPEKFEGGVFDHRVGELAQDAHVAVGDDARLAQAHVAHAVGRSGLGVDGDLEPGDLDVLDQQVVQVVAQPQAPHRSAHAVELQVAQHVAAVVELALPAAELEGIAGGGLQPRRRAAAVGVEAQRLLARDLCVLERQDAELRPGAAAREQHPRTGRQRIDVEAFQRALGRGGRGAGVGVVARHAACGRAFLAVGEVIGVGWNRRGGGSRGRRGCGRRGRGRWGCRRGEQQFAGLEDAGGRIAAEELVGAGRVPGHGALDVLAVGAIAHGAVRWHPERRVLSGHALPGGGGGGAGAAGGHLKGLGAVAGVGGGGLQGRFTAAAAREHGGGGQPAEGQQARQAR